MPSPRNLNDWLYWLIRVRFLVILFLVGIELVIRQFSPSPVPVRFFAYVILVWSTLSVFYAVLVGLNLDPYLQAYVQIVVDLVLITGVVYVTGALNSYFIILYSLAILVASILLSRVGSFLLSALGFLLFAVITNATYYEIIPNFYGSSQGIWPVQVHLLLNLSAFFGIWYLSSTLAESLRRTGVALEDKAGELEDLQAFHENVFHSMGGGLLTTDLDGKILQVNPAAEAVLDLEAGRIRGLPLTEVVAELAALVAEPENLYRLNRSEVAVGTPAGQRILGVRLSALRAADEVDRGYIFSFQDLTELKRLEAEVQRKERMASLGRMAAAIAHEIRNPLAAIAGSVRELARYAEAGDDERKLVDIVSRESERLNRLVNETLSYSQVRELHREPVDLVQLAEETLILLAQNPNFSKGIEVNREFPGAPVVVPVDPAQIKQVLWNLCDNAARAMGDGGVLRVGVSQRNGSARLRVQDSGCGLTAGQREKIFEPFETGFERGTGLGLAIVYQIVQAHGGKVWAEDCDGGGTRFLVDLPAGSQLAGASGQAGARR